MSKSQHRNKNETNSILCPVMTGSDPHCDDCVTTILHKLQCFAQGRNEGLLLKGCTQQFSMLLSPQKLA